MKKICFLILGVSLLVFQSSIAQSNFVQWGSVRPNIEQKVIQIATIYENTIYLLEDGTVQVAHLDYDGGVRAFFEGLSDIRFVSPSCAVSNQNQAYLKFGLDNIVLVQNVIKGYQDESGRFLIMKTDSSVYFVDENGEENLNLNDVRDISMSAGTGVIYFKNGDAILTENQTWSQVPSILDGRIKHLSFSRTFIDNLFLAITTDSTLLMIEESEQELIDTFAIQGVIDVQTNGTDHVLLTASGDMYKLQAQYDGNTYYYSFEQLTAFTGVKSISFSLATLGLLDDGTVINGEEIRYREFIEFDPDFSQLIDLSRTDNYSLGLKTDSTVIAFGGLNTFGELNVPSNLTGVVDISASLETAVAIKNDGTVVCWGNITFAKYNELSTIQNAKAAYHDDNDFFVLLNDGRLWSSRNGFLSFLPSLVQMDSYQGINVGLTVDSTVVTWESFDVTYTDVLGLTSIVDITPYYALTSSGEVKGINFTPSFEIQNLTSVIDIDSKEAFVCLLNDGTIRSFDSYRGDDDTPTGKYSRVLTFGLFEYYAFSEGLGTSEVTRLIKGGVYQNEGSQSCENVNKNQPYPNAIIRVMPNNFYASSNEQGLFEVPVSMNAQSYTVERIPSGYKEVNCVDAFELNLPQNEDDFCCIDFNVQKSECSVLYIGVSGALKRRCFNSTTTISYGNYGNGDAGTTQVVVEYPSYIVPKKSVPAWTSKVGNKLIYDLTGVQSDEKSSITISDSVSCFDERILGMTQCIEAQIKQLNECTEIINSGWDQVELDLVTRCEDGVVKSSIINNTTFDMQDSTEYRISINDTLVKKSKIRLKANTQVQVGVEAFGDLISYDIDQTIGFPGDSIIVDFVEGCISQTQTLDNVVKGLALNQKYNSTNLEDSKVCFGLVGSYDPNDKQAVPIGLTNAHYVPAGTAIDYTIRFQNTGTDTAFKVVLVDTLDAGLDISTFIQGASSHPYTLSVSGEGQPVLTFTFRNINLPDSNVNVLESNGFVNFKINTYSNLTDETAIYNEAAIYFDFNSPVITNEVYHTIGHPRWENFSKASLVSVSDDIPVGDNHDQLFINLMIYPNPTTGTINISGAQAGDELKLKNVFGQEVYNVQLTGSTTLTLQDLSKGIYLYQVYRKGEVLAKGKVIRE